LLAIPHFIVLFFLFLAFVLLTIVCTGSRSAPPTSPARPSSCTRRPQPRRHRRRGRTIAEMMAKGTYASINLATPDLDGTFERLQASDAEVVQEPTEQPYGVRDCASAIPRAT
jgi:hypothetical protein